MLTIRSEQIERLDEEVEQNFKQNTIKRLREKVVQFLTENGEMAAPDFKEMTGVSRKYLIPLLEYFDAQNVTIRVGDVRRLRKS